MTALDLTFAIGRPMLVFNPEFVTYSEPILDAKGKVVGTKPWGFTVASCRPATAEEVDAWRVQA